MTEVYPELNEATVEEIIFNIKSMNLSIDQKLVMRNLLRKIITLLY